MCIFGGSLLSAKDWREDLNTERRWKLGTTTTRLGAKSTKFLQYRDLTAGMHVSKPKIGKHGLPQMANRMSIIQ